MNSTLQEPAEGGSSDPSEPGGTPWRAIDWHRCGKRGQSQKLTFLRTGLQRRVLSNAFPWILDGGSEYISESRASVRFEVLAQAEEAVWISSESEAEEPPVVRQRTEPKSSVAPKGSVAREPVIRTQEPKAYSVSFVPRQPLFPPPQREPLALVPLPAAKASGASSSSSKASPKAPPPKRGSLAKAPDASSSTSKVELKKADPKPPQQQQLKPTVLLPDSATLYCWDPTEKPSLVLRTRGFRGTCGIYTEYPPEGKVLLVLDWHQTLSRSRTASAEAIQKIPEENLELLQKLKDRYQNRLVIAVCSFISGSERNLTNLLEACGNTRGLNSLVSFITITRQKCGPQKLRTIESLCQRLTPTILVDDNAEIVSECAEVLYTVHLKLRKKPSAVRSHCVKQFLEDCFDVICEQVELAVPNWRENQERRRQELNVSLDPLLVAQAHHVVEQNRVSIISQAQEALNQSRDQMRDEANQAVIQAQEAVKAEALTYIQKVEAEAKQNASDAQTQIEHIRKRAAESSTELRNRAKAEVAMVEAEAKRRIAYLEGRISELTAERDNLAQMVQGMSNNQDGFENTVQSLVEEKETLANRVQSLMTNQDVLEGDTRSLMDEREMLTKRVQMLIDEKQDTMLKAQRMLDERDTLISDLTGWLQALNNRSTAMRQPAQAIVEAGNGAGSSKGMPKHEVKSKQSVETAIQEMRTMLEKLEQRVSRSPSAVSQKSNSSSSSSSKPKGGGGSPGNSSGGGSNGRSLLWTVFQKFKLDKDRGSLEQADMPSDQALRSLLFENLKSHPKLTLAIDKFREARVGSSKRTWNSLFEKMEEAIEIDQLDENTGHVEKALQSSGGHKVNANAAKTDDAKPYKPKKEKPTKTKEDKSNKEAKKKTEKPKKEKKTSEAADASVAAAPGQSKGKSKGKGTEKPSASSSTKPSKEDKKKDPCMYFAYSACAKGDKCPYLHDKNNLYKGPKPKALTTSHAGAAHIVSGAVAATTILGTEGATSLSAPCRHVVEEESMPAVDDPLKPAASSSDPVGDAALREGEKPVPAPSESAEIEGEKPLPAPPESDVPPGEVLTRDVDERLLEGDPEVGSDYTPSVAEDVPKEDPATGGELVLASDPSCKGPPSSDDEVEEISANQQLTRYPKSRSCEVCMRAKMTARYHRKRGDPDPDEAPPLHYGHQIRVDHLIMGSDLQKGSEGEQACLICFDEFSGCYQAFPQTQRTIENNIACLRKFGGAKVQGKALCVVKSDAAKELTEAVKALDWLPDEAIPNDAFHNAKLESNIRRLKEGVRACHLAAGFSHELWPRLLLEEESKKAKTEAEEKKKILALEDKPKILSEPSRGPELPDFENLMEAVHESDEAKRKAKELPAGAAKAKASTDTENLGDYWEYD
eukprot:Skav200637  [mRNA]  locus=scaffold353:180885:187483:+ [translate_table: standard]